MPANWHVKATLDGTPIINEEVELPGRVSSKEAMNHIAVMVYLLPQCLAAPAGAQLDIFIQQVQTPWWWD